MMKILLFGKSGQLGWELRRTLAPLGEVIALEYPDVDFTKPLSLVDVIDTVEPDLIINAVAYTAVDSAETHQHIAQLINCDSVAVLAQQAARMQIPLVHYSTDYVYDGSKGSPYIETDQPNPLNVYGVSKLRGDEAVLESGGAGVILRTSWVYSLRQAGFVSKVLSWARQQEVLRIVDDQVSGPTSSRMLAEASALMIARAGGLLYDYFSERAGVYHLAGDGACSRYEWARAIIALDPNKHEHKVKELIPAKSDEFPTLATRPLVSVLNCDKFADVFGLRLPRWEVGLGMMMEEGLEKL